jgi:hypothetical protein
MKMPSTGSVRDGNAAACANCGTPLRPILRGLRDGRLIRLLDGATAQAIDLTKVVRK